MKNKNNWMKMIYHAIIIAGYAAIAAIATIVIVQLGGTPKDIAVVWGITVGGYALFMTAGYLLYSPKTENKNESEDENNE